MPLAKCSFGMISLPRHSVDRSPRAFHSSTHNVVQETEGREYHTEVQKNKTDVVWPPKEARPRLRRRKDSGDGTTCEKKARKTEAEMYVLCQTGHETHQNDKYEVGPT